MSPPVPKFAIFRRFQVASAGAAEVGPTWRSRSKPRLCVGLRRARQQGIILPLRTPLPSKALAKMTQDSEAAFFALLLRSADWEFTSSATCCRPTSLLQELSTYHSHLGELGKEFHCPPAAAGRLSPYLFGAFGRYAGLLVHWQPQDPHSLREQVRITQAPLGSLICFSPGLSAHNLPLPQELCAKVLARGFITGSLSPGSLFLGDLGPDR